ncbi:MAG: pyridoxamine 5'-phosphate oxidase [Bacteroidetes bacterium]|nr:pyridoxamine 5'-phosphate oxidase [Bacteroidota bacterium]
MKNISDHIKQLRNDFIKGSLSENETDTKPGVQFSKWLNQAIESEVEESQAFVLSTVNALGKPSSRILYLRGLNENNFYFFTNFNSKKGGDIASNPNASMCFFYPELERQIRIEGTVSFADENASNEYFNSRPRESQIGAWSSPQSKIIKNREELEQAVIENTKRFENSEISRPDFWGGYVLKANYYEFWQGRHSRLHDRICYELKNNTWLKYRIAP